MVRGGIALTLSLLLAAAFLANLSPPAEAAPPAEMAASGPSVVTQPLAVVDLPEAHFGFGRALNQISSTAPGSITNTSNPPSSGITGGTPCTNVIGGVCTIVGAGTAGTFTKTGQDVTGTFRLPATAASGVVPVAFIPTTVNANPGEQIGCNPVNGGTATCAGHTTGDPVTGGLFRMLYTQADGTRGVVYATVNADVNASPVPCPPGHQPSQAAVTVAPSAPNRVQVTLAAGRNDGIPQNVLLSVNFESTANALVDITGQSGITGPFSVTLPPGTDKTSFFVRQINASSAATVQLALTDVCGVWHTFAGAGPEIFSQAPTASSRLAEVPVMSVPGATAPAASVPAATVPAPSAPAASAPVFNPSTTTTAPTTSAPAAAAPPAFGTQVAPFAPQAVRQPLPYAPYGPSASGMIWQPPFQSQPQSSALIPQPQSGALVPQPQPGASTLPPLQTPAITPWMLPDWYAPLWWPNLWGPVAPEPTAAP